MPTTEQMHLDTLRRRRDHLSNRLDNRSGDSRNGMQYDRLELAALEWALDELEYDEEADEEGERNEPEPRTSAGRVPGRA